MRDTLGKWFQEEELLLDEVMDGMAGQATSCRMSMSFGAQILMAGTAACADGWSSGVGETEDLTGISIAVDVGLAGTVAGLAALLLWFAFLEEFRVRGIDQVFIRFVVTGLTGLTADEATFLCLAGKANGGGEEAKNQQ